ncbi:hypothetical protein CCR94_17875 [Rhodoblastus sphagnicola]|uniref:Secretin/TonB short N-terminal domain-containing protein n=1 Tax=Rhodoblastus sphagnicola TaxID=333368 RepID=A0A2S6N1F6_9HYPH|nr:STN domain-containing protein [Rhodoblastus sphagnicola]MBB4198999.1 hypothetical protein [Rhodoblastus sphagnicola]PPQ28428.1 hypothetical protein CCR94_17875 [Rhodoblastus sphagnicola]
MLKTDEHQLKADQTIGAYICVYIFFSLFFVIYFMLASTITVAAQKSNEIKQAHFGIPVQFDIPAQPLADALYAYSSVTGIEILVPGDMLTRFRTSAITGMLTPEDALRILLAGTSLAPHGIGDGSITLVPNASAVSSAPIRAPRYPEYSAALQWAVTKALCQFRETRPGGFRVVARLWVGPGGEVTRVQFLGATGDADRDTALAGLLKQVVVGQPPPADLSQPSTVLVLPHQAKEECRMIRGAGATP